jgi:hypothetical protein
MSNTKNVGIIAAMSSALAMTTPARATYGCYVNGSYWISFNGTYNQGYEVDSNIGESGTWSGEQVTQWIQEHGDYHSASANKCC